MHLQSGLALQSGLLLVINGNFRHVWTDSIAYFVISVNFVKK